MSHARTTQVCDITTTLNCIQYHQNVNSSLSLSGSDSINQTNKTHYIAAWVASKAEVHNGRDWAECSCLLYAMSNSSVFKLWLKVLISSADLQLYDSEFQIEEALMLKAFTNNASTIYDTAINNMSDVFAFA